MQDASVVGGGDGVAVAVDDAAFEVQKTDPVFGANQVGEFRGRHAGDLHQPAGAMVSRPQPYALAWPIPPVSACRNTVGSVTVRMPS
ncbi:hypothetical protein Cs7R123_45890 [Catellatospora sp. TT07R-123]|nr:hypothetical protein Cs7R123_45890 [Catellatospora sp. TT07R-123]